jgi:hypothetical protein
MGKMLALASSFLLLVLSTSAHALRYPGQTHQLFRRDIVSTCPNEGTFAAGSATDFASSPVLKVAGDAYLQAFVAPKSGFICTLAISIQEPPAEVKATLRLYNDSTPQISIVNGTGVAQTSVTTT